MGNQKVATPPPLSAQDKSSFAYKTIKDRLPVIIVRTIDFLHRQRKELHKFGGTLNDPNGENLVEIENDAKNLISQLTKIRKDVETNKTVVLFDRINDLEKELEYFNDDIDQWNKSLEDNKLDDGSLPRWFDSPWLLVECYLYRKIKEAALQTKHLKMFDPFVEQKQNACNSCIAQMLVVANHLRHVEKTTRASTNHTHPSERTEFGLFIQLALWANKCDLSLSGMSSDNVQSNPATDIRESLEDLHEKILCDNMSDLWFKAQSIKDMVRSASRSEKLIYIDLVADNAGYEVFVDLCLLHFLTLMICPISLENSGVRFRIHVKRLPWFVSDTIRQDIDWLLSLMTGPEQDPALSNLAEKWKYYFSTNFWELHDHKFWTLPYDYAAMPTVASDLYGTMKQSSLIILKGDLNYRKLVGDRKWHLLTPFRAALREFEPAPLVSLRTIKADVVVGIEDINIFAKINNNELPRDWMISGEYGLIQYLDLA